MYPRFVWATGPRQAWAESPATNSPPSGRAAIQQASRIAAHKPGVAATPPTSMKKLAERALETAIGNISKHKDEDRSGSGRAGHGVAPMSTAAAPRVQVDVAEYQMSKEGMPKRVTLANRTNDNSYNTRKPERQPGSSWPGLPGTAGGAVLNPEELVDVANVSGIPLGDPLDDKQQLYPNTSVDNSAAKKQRREGEAVKHHHISVIPRNLSALQSMVAALWDELSVEQSVRALFLSRHIKPLVALETSSRSAEQRQQHEGSGGLSTGEMSAYHRHHVNIHVALLRREKELVVDACDAIHRRELAMKELRFASAAYRHWSTQHLLEQHHNNHLTNHFGAKKAAAGSSSQKLSSIISETHSLLDRYREATVDVLECVMAWKDFVQGHSFAGVDEALNERIARGNMSDVEMRSLARRERRDGIFRWKGVPIASAIWTDLHATCFANEPIAYLFPTSFQWNPFALPGDKWKLVPKAQAKIGHKELGATPRSSASSSAVTPRGAQASQRTITQRQRLTLFGPSARSRAAAAQKVLPPHHNSQKEQEGGGHTRQPGLNPNSNYTLDSSASIASQVSHASTLFRHQFFANSSKQKQPISGVSSAHQSSDGQQPLPPHLDLLLSRCEAAFVFARSEFARVVQPGQAAIRGSPW